MNYKKIISVILALCLVFSLGATSALAADSEPVLSEATVDEAAVEEALVEEETVIEEVAAEQPVDSAQVDDILALAKTDGAGAAAMLNGIADTAQYESTLRALLDMYYSGDQSQLAAFTAALDGRAAELLAAYSGAAAERASDDELGFVPGQILVMFENGLDGAALQSVSEQEHGAIIQSEALVTGDTLAVVDISLSQTVEQAVAAFEQQSDVKYAQPNYIYSVPQPEEKKEVATNDPLLEDQWYMEKVGINGAHGFVDALMAGEDPKKVRVAVLDTPMDLNHEDLQDSLNKELCVDTSTGVVKPPMEDIGFAEHATHVGGIIAASTNNNKGISGVGNTSRNNIVDLVSVSVLGKSGGGTSLSVATGINYAMRIDAQVINMSLGGYTDLPYGEEAKIERAMCDAAYTRGIITVAAAGNGNTDEPSIPGDFQSVINIIASKDWTDKNDAKASFSDYGTKKDFTAPGVDIVSCVPYSEYDLMSGTSMAAPVVTGIVALLKYVRPDMNMDDVYKLLKASATDLYTPGFDIYSGWGEVNATSALFTLVQDDMADGVRVGETNNFKVKSTGVSSTQLTWSAAKNAEGYIVYKNSTPNEFNDEAYVEIARVTGTSYTDKNLKPGQMVGYKVCGYREFGGFEILGSLTDFIALTPVCAAPKNLTAKSTVKGTANLTWRASAGADGYYVYRAATKGGKYSSVGKISDTKYSDTGLKSGGTYFYKVFPYSIGSEGNTLRGQAAATSIKVK